MCTSYIILLKFQPLGFLCQKLKIVSIHFQSPIHFSHMIRPIVWSKKNDMFPFSCLDFTTYLGILPNIYFDPWVLIFFFFGASYFLKGSFIVFFEKEFSQTFVPFSFPDLLQKFSFISRRTIIWYWWSLGNLQWHPRLGFWRRSVWR